MTTPRIISTWPPTVWHEVPMTWTDGIRLLLAYTLMDAIANGPVIPAYLAGLTGN